jgi:integrase
MQRGSIRKNGNFWWLKYKVREVAGGVESWKDRYHKLAPIDHQHQTKASVQAEADVFLAKYNVDTVRPESGDLVVTYLEGFLAKGIGGRGGALSKNTLRTYRTSFNLCKPHFGNMQLRKVRTPEINEVLRKVQADFADEDGLAQTTYYNLKTFLSSAFRDAVGHGLIDSNPVRDAINIRGNKTDTYAYSLKETKAIIAALEGKPIAQDAVMVFALTGLRMEEVKGLKWIDYDEKVRLLNVQRAVVNGEIVDVKTLHSKAPVPVVKTVAKTLAAHRAANSGDGYIFHGDTGEPMRFENMARRDIIPTLEEKGIKWHGFHAFRRGLTTVMKDMDGIADSTYADIMRHAPEGTTQKHYAKPSLRKMRAALEKVEAQYLAISAPQKRGRAPLSRHTGA